MPVSSPPMSVPACSAANRNSERVSVLNPVRSDIFCTSSPICAKRTVAPSTAAPTTATDLPNCAPRFSAFP